MQSFTTITFICKFVFLKSITKILILIILTLMIDRAVPTILLVQCYDIKSTKQGLVVFLSYVENTRHYLSAIIVSPRIPILPSPRECGQSHLCDYSSFVDAFMVNSSTGEVICVKSLDREQSSEYKLQIQVAIVLPSSTRSKRAGKTCNSSSEPHHYSCTGSVLPGFLT